MQTITQKMYLIVQLSALISGVSAQHSLFKPDYPVNTDLLDEICPVITYDETTLFFTRVADPFCAKTLYIDSTDVFEKYDEASYDSKLKQIYSQIASTVITDPISSGYNQDIWYTSLENTRPVGIFHPGYPINDVLPNSVCSNYGKEKGLMVINQFEKKGGIDRGFSVTEKSGDEFSFPLPINIQHFNKSGAELNITASIDSSVLILSMIDTTGFGNMDLYVSYHLGNNTYSAPIIMSADINTAFRESTPMLTHDTKRLYFTSDRPGSIGGKDIYFAERKDFTYTSWTKPVRLNPPVNSVHDDSHPHVMKDNNTIFFTSDRDGSSDIFQAKLLREALKKEIVITINIKNGVTGNNSPGELTWGDAYQEERPGFFRSKDGLCRYKFYENKPVVFKATNRDIYSEEVIIDPQELINQGKYTLQLELPMYGTIRPEIVLPDKNKNIPLKEEAIIGFELNKTILLNNIYFERTKPVVLPESYPALQKLADVLLSRPRLYISIIGHTDNVGDKDALRILSEDRAMAIRQILIEKGVAGYRVQPLGYGDSRPIAPNDTEENKSKNRRVEIRIISQ